MKLLYWKPGYIYKYKPFLAYFSSSRSFSSKSQIDENWMYKPSNRWTVKKVSFVVHTCREGRVSPTSLWCTAECYRYRCWGCLYKANPLVVIIIDIQSFTVSAHRSCCRPLRQVPQVTIIRYCNHEWVGHSYIQPPTQALESHVACNNALRRDVWSHLGCNALHSPRSFKCLPSYWQGITSEYIERIRYSYLKFCGTADKVSWSVFLSELWELTCCISR